MTNSAADFINVDCVFTKKIDDLIGLCGLVEQECLRPASGVDVNAHVTQLKITVVAADRCVKLYFIDGLSQPGCGGPDF